MSDPLPQALTLTAIVITFAISAFLLALIYRSWQLGQADTVDRRRDRHRGARARHAAEDTMDDGTEIEDEDDEATTDFVGVDTAPITSSPAATSPACATTPRRRPDAARDDGGWRRAVMSPALVPLLVTLPLLGAAIALIAGRHRRPQVVVSVVTLSVVCMIAAMLLVRRSTSATRPIAVSVGGWPIPFGIVLYVDRLAALLVVVSSIVLLAVLLFSVGQGAADGDEETPVSIFHPSYLILAAGIFTAFIAGDLFNLYVGFEILLVASYVLITLGSTESRIRTGVVYIVVSLVSSILFLAAIAMIYGALGTVNMVQISERMGELPQQTQLVLHLHAARSRSASRRPSSRCRSGCPTRTRPRRRR